MLPYPESSHSLRCPLPRTLYDGWGRVQPVAIGNYLSDSCTVPRLRPALFDARR